MNENYLILLLQIVKHNGSLDSLLNKGLEYSQIALLLKEAEQSELVYTPEGRGMMLTDSGEGRLKELTNKLTAGKSGFWIEPFDQGRIDKIEMSDIYIPIKGKVNLE